MTTDVLLCADLDRTVLPNGNQPESPAARPLLRALAKREELTLVYVTGRHQAILKEAIEEFDIPVPAYAIGDVGTSIYDVSDGAWRTCEAWREEIARDWRGRTHAELADLLEGIEDLELQEREKQNPLKLSYYAPEDVDSKALLAAVEKRLEAREVRTRLTWSVDEVKHRGLLDVLPHSASKLHAMRFFMREKGFEERHTVFAGDSGNDLPALTSGLQAVLVRNATEEVRAQAMERARAAGCADRLYFAEGGFLGMNGNYSAGVLEGLAHFVPRARRWLEEIHRRSG